MNRAVPISEKEYAMTRLHCATSLLIGLAVCLGSAPATAPATRPAAARDPRDLSTVPGVSLIRKARNQEEAEEQQGGPSLLSFSRSRSFFGNTTIEATGHPEAILRTLGDGGRVFLQGVTLPKESFILKASGGQTSVVSDIHKTFEQAFKVRITHEQREADVLVLTVDPDKVKELASDARRTTSYSSHGGMGMGMTTMSGTLPQLASSLERQLDVPVIDESRRGESFELSFSWTQATKRDDIIAALDKQGVILKPAKRKLRGVFVDKPLPATQPGHPD